MLNREDLKIGNIFRNEENHDSWSYNNNGKALRYYKVIGIDEDKYTLVYGSDAENFESEAHSFLFSQLTKNVSLYSKINNSEANNLNSIYRLDEII